MHPTHTLAYRRKFPVDSDSAINDVTTLSLHNLFSSIIVQLSKHWTLNLRLSKICQIKHKSNNPLEISISYFSFWFVCHNKKRIYIYIYIYIYTHIHIYIYTYIHTYTICISYWKFSPCCIQNLLNSLWLETRIQFVPHRQHLCYVEKGVTVQWRKVK
jgi:hypothetical protein